MPPVGTPWGHPGAPRVLEAAPGPQNDAQMDPKWKKIPKKRPKRPQNLKYGKVVMQFSYMPERVQKKKCESFPYNI